MSAMTSKDLLTMMKNKHVEIDPVQDSESVYEFKIDHHPFGHLDKYGNLYMDTFAETVSRPLSIGKKVITRWVDQAVKGFRINLRRIQKWQ